VRGAAEIAAVGMTTAVGIGAAATAAAVRAGIAGFAASPVHDRRVRPMTLALLPERALPPLEPAVAKSAPGLTAREARMLRLAAPALAEALDAAGLGGPVPLLLAVPEPRPGRRPPAGDRFLDHLAAQAGVALDPAASRLLPAGRAAGLAALAAAAELVAAGAPAAVAGGVDSYLDLHLLASLDLENRVLAPGIADGFIPGEGAGFVVVRAAGAGDSALAGIAATGSGAEPGHRTSDEPCRGDGLAGAVQAVFAAAPDAPPVATVFAGLNGESFGAREWGVAYLRSADRFADRFAIEHPVDCFGDPAAALGPLLAGLAALGLARGRIAGPCLVWCSSDGEERAAALLTAPPPQPKGES
jgi:3-oxoacyl-[acyl-carrier-protein] synthase-1